MSKAQAVSKAVTLDVDFQLAVSELEGADVLPSQQAMVQWATAAYTAVAQLDDLPEHNEVTIRVVDTDEMVALNRDYRAKDCPTNVLSFPAEIPAGVEMNLLGDIIICHDVIMAEAAQQNKKPHQHYAHMVAHGILHLCGYDHQNDDEANLMESLEVKILTLSGVPNPYT